MGKDVFLVDSGRETAVYATYLLEKQNLRSNNNKKGSCTFYVSDSIEGFTQSANIFLQKNTAKTVAYIDIEAFSQNLTKK